MTYEALFEPFSINKLVLPNRFVMAPMTRLFAKDGIIAPETGAYYRKRAEGGVGLILTELSVVDREASHGDPAMPRLNSEASFDAWRRVADDVHAANGRIGLQIGHFGANSNPITGWLPEGRIDSVCGFDNSGSPLGEPMRDSDIADTIAAFANAAAQAQRIGFDTVEIHAAHGHLIDQFAWAFTNRRTDAWGGNMSGRSRFAAEIVRAVREATGPDFPIIMRLSQWKIGHYEAKVAATPAELEAWVTPLVDAGVDALHGSQRRYWEPEFEGSDLNFAGWLKKLSGKPSITVGSVGLSGEFMAAYAGESSEPRSIDGLYERMVRGEFDMVAVGRALLSDPDWVKKVRDGRIEELRAFDPSAFKTLS
ncbi:NADH:flavin oxidoreductase [Pseudomonas sp. nanlin1]|uniref:NADH:flavin oxidoreductase n=1 Tax=Pseudomonas sp. nanlin1 TaxID=3040605 RepID=UPI00388FAEAF